MNIPRELYIIGYSFCDRHINKTISESCKLGTRLIVFDVISFKEWFIHVKSQFSQIAPEIAFKMEWLKRYHNETFLDLFPILSHEDSFKFDGDRKNSLHRLENEFFTEL